MLSNGGVHGNLAILTIIKFYLTKYIHSYIQRGMIYNGHNPRIDLQTLFTWSTRQNVSKHSNQLKVHPSNQLKVHPEVKLRSRW